MFSNRMITSTLITLALVLSASPGRAEEWGRIAARVKSHQRWCELQSVGQTLHKPGAGATQTPGARVLFLEPIDFVQRVEAGQRPTGGRVGIAVEKNSPAARALALAGLSQLTFKAPNGKIFSLRDVKLEPRLVASGDYDEMQYFEVMSWSWGERGQ